MKKMRDIAWTRSGEGTPLYLQLARSLREHINAGGIDPGSALPSERDLSELSGLSRVTVRKGLKHLTHEGFLIRKQGSGTFVALRIETPSAKRNSIIDDSLLRGDDPSVVWIYKFYAQPTEDEASALDVSTTARVARFGSVRMIGGEPLAIEHTAIPAPFMPDLESLGDSLYDTLEAHGFRPTSGTQHVRASLATQTEAAILCVEQNSEVLRIDRRTRISDGRIIAFSQSVYRGDRYEFVAELNEL